MNLNDFIARVIDVGVEAAKRDYSEPKDAHKLAGSVEGFEACAGKAPLDLLALLTEARAEQQRLFDRSEPGSYWRAACKAFEIEWVCNCVSVILINQGMSPIVPVTARGMMAASGILAAEATP